MNKVTYTDESTHPDMLVSLPSVTNRKHPRGRGTHPTRSPLRDIPYLSGSVIERKKQLTARTSKVRASGDKHYMRRRKKDREKERKAFRTTSRGIKHLYTYWRNVHSPTDVSFSDWFVLYTSFEASESAKRDGVKERVCIRRYDSTKPWFLDNLYLARMISNRELELLADASTLVGERKDVKVYVAPSGKMDARRQLYTRPLGEVREEQGVARLRAQQVELFRNVTCRSGRCPHS